MDPNSADLYDLFAQESMALIEEIRMELGRAEPSSQLLQRKFHALKGAAAAVGSALLAQKFGELEVHASRWKNQAPLPASARKQIAEAIELNDRFLQGEALGCPEEKTEPKARSSLFNDFGAEAVEAFKQGDSVYTVFVPQDVAAKLPDLWGRVLGMQSQERGLSLLLAAPDSTVDQRRVESLPGVDFEILLKSESKPLTPGFEVDSVSWDPEASQFLVCHDGMSLPRGVVQALNAIFRLYGSLVHVQLESQGLSYEIQLQFPGVRTLQETPFMIALENFVRQSRGQIRGSLGDGYRLTLTIPFSGLSMPFLLLRTDSQICAVPGASVLGIRPAQMQEVGLAAIYDLPQTDEGVQVLLADSKAEGELAVQEILGGYEGLLAGMPDQRGRVLALLSDGRTFEVLNPSDLLMVRRERPNWPTRMFGFTTSGNSAAIPILELDCIRLEQNTLRVACKSGSIVRAEALHRQEERS